MTSHLNSHRTTDIKQEMLSGVQTGNGTPHDKYNIRGIASAHKQKRRHFHAKTTSAKLYYYIGVRSMDLFIDEAHTVLDIFPACCLVRFAAFFMCKTYMSNFHFYSKYCICFLVLRYGTNNIYYKHKSKQKNTSFTNLYSIWKCPNFLILTKHWTFLTIQGKQDGHSWPSRIMILLIIF